MTAEEERKKYLTNSFIFIISILGLVFFITWANYTIISKHGIKHAELFVQFPFTFLGSLFVFFGMGKLIYDTMTSNKYKEREIRSKLSEYTETVIINNWENDCIKNPELNKLYEKVFSKPYNDDEYFMTKKEWEKKNINVPYVPYRGNELEWHYCAKFCQHLVNIYRMFHLDETFIINNEDDLKKSFEGVFAGWITCFRIFLSVPIARNVWEQVKYRHGNPKLSAWVKYFCTDPLDKDPKFFYKHRKNWDKAINQILNKKLG